MVTVLPCGVLHRHTLPILLGLTLWHKDWIKHNDASIDLYIYEESGGILHRCVEIAIDGTSVSVSTVTHTQTVLPTVKQYGRFLFDF